MQTQSQTTTTDIQSNQVPTVQAVNLAAWDFQVLKEIFRVHYQEMVDKERNDVLRYELIRESQPDEISKEICIDYLTHYFPEHFVDLPTNPDSIVSIPDPDVSLEPGEIIIAPVTTKKTKKRKLYPARCHPMTLRTRPSKTIIKNKKRK